MSCGDQRATSTTTKRRSTTTETVTKTVVLPLETSRSKNDRVRAVVDQWQQIAGRMADLMPSVGQAHWRAQDSTLFHLVSDEFPDHGLRAHDANHAAYKVGEAFGSWDSNGRSDHRPQFGDGDYARFCHCGVEVVENERGFGLKICLEPYNPEWWHVSSRPYIDDHLRPVVTGEASTGSAELHLGENGGLTCHLSISQDVEVYEAGETPRTLGVDLGERVIYAAAVTDNGGDVVDVEMRTGGEFRDARERLKHKRQKLMEVGDLAGVKQCRDEHRRYTDHMTHVASREIVDLAVEHRPCTIVLEDLTGYREAATEPIHDWPFAELQTKIAYKATEEGIPVVMIDAAQTSITCSECGSEHPKWRNGDTFNCRDCGYEVHADVNAAKNISEAL